MTSGALSRSSTPPPPSTHLPLGSAFRPAADAKFTAPLIKAEAGDIQDVGKATKQVTRWGIVL
jgi:hypothetical protein